ncbi:Crp/Fnr family transcriptional regulator [Acuticoccus sediminis]|uniref:Crp/Fnr family transcriptional regulator n=1 Tax=Acuticoccus sediminis TaxID=2184697 RepID=UPI001CFDA602|nr:Crp/Fnr family transcriptional regulator [Acuticoccus sediminis]
MGHVGLEEASRLLARNGWLTQTPAPFRERILGASRLLHFERRQTIYDVGDPPRGAFGVATGAVNVEIALNSGGTHTAYVGTHGFWIGETAMVKNRPHVVSLVAARPCTVLHLSTEAFEEIAAEDPTAWRWIALLTAQLLDSALQFIEDMMIPSSRERVVAILLSLSGCRDLATDNDLRAIDLTHEEVGRLTNLSRSRLATILRDLRDDGLIDCSYRTIRILEPSRLRECL